MKIKKRVGFLTFAAVVFLTFCLPFFSGCKKELNEKSRYLLDLTLKGNVLEGVLDYSEGLGAQSDGRLCFCLQPNYLLECERLKNSKIEGLSEESASGEKLAEQPLKITAASAGYELLQNGAYALLNSQTAGGERRVKISFTVQIQNNGGRLALTDDGINLACFYPYRCVYENGWFTPSAASEGDPFYGDFADYDITLRVPSSLVVAGNAPRSLDIGGGVAEYKYELKNRRSVAFCLSENFNVISKKWGNKSINCYFINGFNGNKSGLNNNDGGNERLSSGENAEAENADLGYAYYEKLTVLAADCLAYFSERFGEYPYGDYSIAFTPFYCGGMEYPALSVINKNQSVQNVVKAVVHETAHQWFPLLVSNNEYSEAYFDEGLSEFASFSYFTSKKSDLAEEMLDSARKTVINYVNNVCKKMQMNRNLNEFNGEYDYYACVYARGLLAFCEAQKIAGESRFNAALKKFVEKNVFKRAGAGEFLNVLSHRAAKNTFLSIVDGKALLCLPK